MLPDAMTHSSSYLGRVDQMLTRSSSFFGRVDPPQSPRHSYHEEHNRIAQVRFASEVGAHTQVEDVEHNNILMGESDDLPVLDNQDVAESAMVQTVREVKKTSQDQFDNVGWLFEFLTSQSTSKLYQRRRWGQLKVCCFTVV
ncbi:hypothetical protein ElyMa_002831400 [Elysia marginata]|uniref:Uncharacterized protein n=1 Tax=Elysia marginata TaxID=1093978 RepID=A0AAV4HUR2_9GAST|nr:hypothetical protein ElyMa_002831400 [Elysia marginata]